MKSGLMLLAAALTFSTVIASDLPDDRLQCLSMNMRDGKVRLISLRTNPRTAVADGMLKLTTDEAVFEFPLEEVASYTFVKDPSSLGKEIADKTEMFELDGNQLTVRCQGSGTLVLSDIEGRTLRTLVSEQGGTTVIDLGTLPQGVYIASYGSNSFKFRKP